MKSIFAFFSNLLITKKASEQLISSAHHEAGHCVMAFLFNDCYTSETITINPIFAQSVNNNFSGAFKIISKHIASTHNTLHHEVLILSAGVCSQILYNEGLEYVNRNFIKLPINLELLFNEGGRDDREKIKLNLKYLSDEFNISEEIIWGNAVLWTFKFFKKEIVWKTIQYISEKLIEKKGLTLNKNEIENIIKKSGLKKYLEKNRIPIREEIYPLSKESLLIV